MRGLVVLALSSAFVLASAPGGTADTIFGFMSVYFDPFLPDTSEDSATIHCHPQQDLHLSLYEVIGAAAATMTCGGTTIACLGATDCDATAKADCDLDTCVATCSLRLVAGIYARADCYSHYD